ncbi:MAG: flagellar brake protein [Thauera sp.]|nr:flagellar brake protein [Thauera sp.]
MSTEVEAAPSTQAGSTPLVASAEARADRIDWLSMRPMVGDALQLDCGTPLSSNKTYSRLVGYLKDKLLITTTPVAAGRRLELLEGDNVLVRGFSGINAYAFRAHVLRVSRLPFDHVYLSYPDSVSGRSVRGSHRTRTTLTVKLSTPEISIEGQMLDLSAHGALVSSTTRLDDDKRKLLLKLELVVHQISQQLEIDTTVMNHSIDDTQETPRYRYGLRFDDLDEHSIMLLKAFVYEQVVDHPESIF